MLRKIAESGLIPCCQTGQINVLVLPDVEQQVQPLDWKRNIDEFIRDSTTLHRYEA